ncbi:MAG: LysR family transcriptional regulator [Desulfobacteraceae bacterium]|nr:LysR family transcriptional regulator [Desulfobacteraceae bacterium]
MDIRHFKTFKTIVDVGSFIKAAGVLNYAQSSVTSHIQAMESFYGQPLFDRIGKRVVVNAFGKEVYQQARTLLDAWDRACDLKQDMTRPSGKIRVGVPESTMLYRFSPVLKRYKQLYPGVEIIMVNAACPEMRGALKAGELDIALLLEQERTDRDLLIEPLMAEPMGIVLPGDYPGNELTHPLDHAVLCTEKGCSYRKIFMDMLAQKRIEPENIIETSSVEVIKRYILCGLGISFLPTIVVSREIEQDLVRTIPWQTDDPVLLQIARHKGKWVSPAMAELIKLTKKQFSETQ